jgi:muramoyltetrapeptide carboxypeptidase
MPPVIPPYLKPGDTIGITCPAGYVANERVEHCIEVLERWSFNVKLGATVGTEHFYFSGPDPARLADLQAMLDDDSVQAILMGRGGYGMSRIIDDLDFTRFVKKPKWIWGFSDITILHSHIQRHFGIATLHGPMCGAFRQETDDAAHLEATRQALLGSPLRYETDPHEGNRHGTAEAILTGGNLAILAHLTGSPSQVDTSGKILFLEDIGEYRYNLDRMLVNLRRSGQLANIKGLILGDFTDTQDTERPFGQEVVDLISDKVAEYSYPVLFGLPAGHDDVNFPLRLGTHYKMEVTEDGGVLTSRGNTD